ncbi:MAG TPA: hemerythrin domain-containing protein [Nitrospira sp.]|jgi:hemerythrin superfamily protein|nr:hemerythrin domain-containing protein [Nitrospira sp.]
MAKRTPKKPKSSQPQDAVQLLKADHKQVRKLFEQFHGASDDEKGSIASRLFTELDIHSKLEEELFYPAVQSKLESLEYETQGNGLDVTDDGEIDPESESAFDEIDGAELEELDDEEEEEAESEIITAAYDSHSMVKDLIQQLRTLDPTSSDYRDLFMELEDAVIEHVTEEEDAILPLAAAQLDVQTLGMTMQRRKDDLSSQSSLAA